MSAQGEEEQQTYKQQQQRNGTRHGFKLPGQGTVRGEDALLTLGVTTALLAFYQVMRPDRQGSSAWAWALFTVGMVIATLSKGVLGLAMPGIAIG